jgi:hypothetical protein
MGPADIPKKKVTGFQGSIALRVLLVSFVFIVVPLVFYSYFIYDREYRGRLKDVFFGLRILETDHLQFIGQMERFGVDYLDTVRDMIALREKTSGEFTDQELAPIFLEFAQNENITALYYLKIFENGDVYCLHSTLPEYINMKFNEYVDVRRVVQEYDRVYIGPDPLFGHSFVIFSLVYKPGGKELMGILGITISLDQLIERLSWLKGLYATDVSILSKEKMVLASTNERFVGQTPPLEDLGPEYKGLSCPLFGKKYYVTMALIPNTREYLMISVPSAVERSFVFHSCCWNGDLLFAQFADDKAIKTVENCDG